MPNQILDQMAFKSSGVTQTYWIANSMPGYFNESDGKFYKESTYTTEIEGVARLVYVDLSTNYIYRYDDLNTEFVQIGGSGSASAAIEYVNSLPSSDIKDVIYGIISRTSYTATVGADFLDSDESFEKTEGTGGAYTYTAAEGAEIEASTDDTTYKGFTSLAFDGTDWTLTYSDSTSTPIAAAASFYYKKVNRMYYAGNETEQSITPFASGGGGGGATYMPGEGVNINNNVISLSPATSSTLGGIKTDNSTIVADANGTISGNYQAGFNVDINGNTIKTKEFVGTTAEWNSLTAAQKAQYTFTMFSDDFSPVDATPGHGITDSTGAEKTQRDTLQFGNEMEVTDDSTNEVTKVNAIPYTAGDKIDITNHKISVDGTLVPSTFTGTQAEWDALTSAEKAEYEIVNITDDVANGGMVVVDTVEENNLNAVTSSATYNALVQYVDLENITTGSDGSFHIASSDIDGEVISAHSHGTHIIVPCAYGGNTYYFASINFSTLTKEVSTNIGTVRVWYKPHNS